MVLLQALGVCLMLLIISESTRAYPEKAGCWNSTEVENEDLFVFGAGADSNEITASSCSAVCGSWNLNYAG